MSSQPTLIAYMLPPPQKMFSLPPSLTPSPSRSERILSFLQSPEEKKQSEKRFHNASRRITSQISQFLITSFFDLELSIILVSIFFRW